MALSPALSSVVQGVLLSTLNKFVYLENTATAEDLDFFLQGKRLAWIIWINSRRAQAYNWRAIHWPRRHLYRGTALRFAFLELREPKFVVGYSGPEIDVALAQGEIDARANSVDAVLQRTPQFINDGLVHFHGVVEVPFGFRPNHPALARSAAIT